MILSRTMRLSDYDQLESEGEILIALEKSIHMWYPALNRHRVWEYCLAQKALRQAFVLKKELRVSDMGCALSFLSPILYRLGHHVYMYEVGQFGWGFKEHTIKQMELVKDKYKPVGTYEFRNRGLGTLTSDDMEMDAAFCISTLEHIENYQQAFVDLCGTVKVGGILLVTTDFAEDEEDHYENAGLRAGKMFTDRTYYELVEIGKDHKFEVFGGSPNWRWGSECNLVGDHGFASLCLRRVA